MAKGDDIENSLVDFAVRIVHLSDNMPDKRSANHIAGQLLRSGTAPAALYNASSKTSRKNQTQTG